MNPKIPKSLEWIQPGVGCVYNGKNYIVVSYPTWHAPTSTWYVDLYGEMIRRPCIKLRPAVVVVLSCNFAKRAVGVLKEVLHWGHHGALKTLLNKIEEGLNVLK